MLSFFGINSIIALKLIVLLCITIGHNNPYGMKCSNKFDDVGGGPKTQKVFKCSMVTTHSACETGYQVPLIGKGCIQCMVITDKGDHWDGSAWVRSWSCWESRIESTLIP